MSYSDAYLKKYLEYLNSNCTYKKVNELTTFFYLKNCM